MTRIRFTEWLFAAVLVIAVHAAALTGWTWLEPTRSGVRLPEKAPAVAAVPADAVALSVTVVGDDQPAGPEPAAAEAPPTGSSNEIIVVPTDPSLPTGAGESTVVIEAPAEPARPASEPARPASEPATPAVEPARPASEPARPAMAALEPPPIEQVVPETQPGRSPLRDPVPQPKIKPGTEGDTAPRDAPPAADAGGTDSSREAAAVETGQPSTDNEPASAAQSAYYRILLAEIKRSQRYPDDAKREGKEGTVYLQIVVVRAGRIRSYDIVKSSGFQELDDAAVQTLVRANENLPPFPGEIADEELRFGLPIRFGS